MKRKAIVAWLACVLLCVGGSASSTAIAQVQVRSDASGTKLQVGGKDLMVFGMNWGYQPIGTDYSYSLWSESDRFIERVLHRDMGLLRAMGVNAIRQFDSVPPRWIKWIYEKYGIYTVVNHLMGRYGFQVDRVWVEHIDYANPTHRAAILADLVRQVEALRDTPGLLMWLLGNENNYALHWTGFDPQALPGKGREDDARAVALYRMLGEAIASIKKRDQKHPVALVNGDLQYLALIKKYCTGLDIMGTNVYRGPSARDLFDEVKRELGLPVLFTEFGADAFDAKRGREDATKQAEIMQRQWEEIYLQSYGKGRAGNAIGGFIFQWSDGWWKSGQGENLSIHDASASWPNTGYPHDFVEGENNMNEEWFGISAVAPAKGRGPDALLPRTAYFVLKAAFALDPYAPDTNPERIRSHFSAISPADYASRYESSLSALGLEALQMVRVSNLAMNLSTHTTRGSGRSLRGPQTIVDHTESFFVDVTVQPTPQVFGRLSLNFLGNVAQNRLNQVFYENRGQLAVVSTAPEDNAATADPPATSAPAPVALYQAEFKVEQPWFDLEGYYRTGHHHWGDEGDFFGLYQEAHYGTKLDLYNGQAPFGSVLTGKKALTGLKVAFGPEIYWGANPQVLAKYHRVFGRFSVAAMYGEEFDRDRRSLTSSVLPNPVSRRATLFAGFERGPFKLSVGGIFAAPQRIGREFAWTEKTTGRGYLDSGYAVYRDEIRWPDTLGAKAKLALNAGKIGWYAQGAFKGLVADGGPDSTMTLTGWSLKESGRGNHVSGLTGMTLTLGSVQIAPNVLYQKPLQGPLPVIKDRFSSATGIYYPGLVARDQVRDPFVVLENRETYAGELLLVYDPTPATWFWHWDRMNREDAKFAASIDAVYRHQPTIRDARLGFLADGTQFSFEASPPARDVWDVTLNWFSSPRRSLRLSGSVFAGKAQANGSDARLVRRYGGTLWLAWETLLFTNEIYLSDWGIYDYQRDFNLTFPQQWYSDLSLGLKPAVFGKLDTRVGLRSYVRTLDRHSEGFGPGPSGSGRAAEFEISTYVNILL